MVTQLCLSLADLAMQMLDWNDPVKQLTDMFGQDPAMVPALLEFWAVLPEEFSFNTRIQMDVRGDILCRYESNLSQRLNRAKSRTIGRRTSG